MLRVGVGNHWTCLVGYRLCSSSLSLRAVLGGLPGKKSLEVFLHFGFRTHVVRTPRVSTLLHVTYSYRLTALTLRWFTMLVCKRAKRLKRKTLDTKYYPPNPTSESCTTGSLTCRSRTDLRGHVPSQKLECRFVLTVLTTSITLCSIVVIQALQLQRRND